ncbi:MAG TPA: hypothetical protein VHY19_13130 [Steroidobacteraceae bacterium]|jgi:hypothetical protein|nr:hypothetical protein [Steroidobacteraceae bacterium]
MSESPGSESRSTSHWQLRRYLEAFEGRLRRLIWLRGGAVVLVVALLITLAGAWLAIRTGFALRALTGARLVLLAALVLTSALLVVRPLRRLKRERSRIVERFAHEFDGRLQTLADLPAGHTFHELLAEDALSIARRHAPSAHVSRARLALAGFAVALPALALLWLAAAGPGLYRDGARALWGGWLFGSLLPAERLAVQPGNQAVRLGGSITVRSFPQGFDPAHAQLHARVGAGPWQQIDMAREDHAFSFTFFSMRAPVSYYVSAAGVRSPAYTLSVVAVPGLERLRLVYHYPDWTHLPERVQEGNGDISAIAGTRVQIQVHASVALKAAELVLDGVASPMQTLGQDGQTQLQVTRDAHYYLATRIGAERVRLSDDFQIQRLPLSAPSVRFTWPGRDYSASSIEEVTTDVQASDAYGLQSLQLRYAVNGGPWHSVPLPANGVSASGEHVFSLESLRTDGVARALAPGDLIAYYATARGQGLVAQSDLYIIDVQPFDKRYSQSQSSGDSAPNEQQQISDRQRQILLGTWNLLRGQGTASAASLRDNAALLATLQTKLAAQAQALAGRTQARQLSQDAKIARFIDSMRHAAAAMQPAATRLAATQLSSAIAPEQQALQYLLQAQSQFTDVQLARKQDDSAQQSGRDLSQIYQLEMDLQKNQYESGSGASPQSADKQSEALARRLQQLAQRQQQLADQMQHTPVATSDQRWQQQSLQRQAEDLQRELAAQAQGGGNRTAPPGSSAGNSPGAAASNASGSAGTPGSEASTPGAGTPGAGTPVSGAGTQNASTQSGGTGAAPASGTSLLGERLAAAIRAMGDASQASGAGGAAGAMHTDAPAAARRAQQALSEAASELARERAQQLQQSVSQLAERAAQLQGQQAASAQALQKVEGADGLGQRALADQKRSLSAAVRQLDDAIAAEARAHREDAPATAAALGSAQATSRQADLANRLDIAAQALDLGAARAVLPREAQITQGLAEVQRQLQAAARIAGQGSLTAGARADPLADELARLRTLRSQLQQQANAAQSEATSAAAGTANPLTAHPKHARATGPTNPTLADATLAGPTSAGVAAGAARLLPLLRAQGANAHELATVQRIARTLGDSPPLPAGRAPDVQRLRGEVDLLDALELQLERRAAAGQPTRTAVAGRGAEQYQRAVAEYYRQLSRQ